MECTPRTIIKNVKSLGRNIVQLTFEVESYDKTIVSRSYRHPYTFGLFKVYVSSYSQEDRRS